MVVVKGHQVRSRRNDFRETVLVTEAPFGLPFVLIFRSFAHTFVQFLRFRFPPLHRGTIGGNGNEIEARMAS